MPKADRTGSASASSGASSSKHAVGNTRRNRQQAAIADFGIYALKEVNVGVLLEKVVAEAAHILDAEFGELLERLPDEESLRIETGIGWSDDVIHGARLQGDLLSQAGFALVSQEPVVVVDLPNETRFRPSPLLLEHGIVSGISVVVHGVEHPYGVLGFHTVQRRRFSDDDVHFVQAVANLLAAAIERHRTEDALRRSQKELSDFVENATVGLHWVGPDGTILWANKAELDLLGYAPEEYIGRHIAHFHADEPVIEDILCRLTEGEELHSYEARMCHKDGSIRHVLISSNVLWEDGRFVHTRCFTRDVSERKQAEDRLRAEHAFRKAIEEAVPAGIIVTDLDGRQSYVNPAFCRMVGWSESELVGARPPFAYWPPEEAAAIQRAIESAVQSEARFDEFGTRFQRRSGERFDVRVALAPVASTDGRLTGLLASVSDVTAFKESERELRELSRSLEQRVAERTAALEQSNRELQNFAYVASHDLREPLRKIVTFASLLIQEAGGHMSDAEGSLLERIQASADRMMSLLEDLLMFARVATQAEPLMDVDLSEAARDVLADLEVRIRDTEGTVDVGPLPTVEASPSQMRQLLQNLISNALKFHRPGVPPHVRVSAEIVSADAASRGSDRMRLIVEDNGLGIDERHIDRIFQPFQRLHGMGSFEGSGLGLAISRRIAERHGGTISAESTLGSGSRFIVSLPLARKELAVES